MNDAICPQCGNDKLIDYPVCLSCAKTEHCPHQRVCLCETCQQERITEALHEAAEAAGGVLRIRRAA